jgi:hypothetical protein
MKICKSCKLETDDFYRRNACCNLCIKNKKHQSYLENKEEIINLTKKYRKDNIEKYMHGNTRRSAKKKGIIFSLSVNDIVIPMVCPYLEVKSFTPSIDRIDNDRGYIKNNILVVSRKSNTMKSNLSLKEITLINENYLNVGCDDGDYNIDSLFWKAKVRGKFSKLEYNINKKDIVKPKYCPLLNILLFKGNGILCDNSPTIDRIDNTIGYVPGNVRIISFKANRSKFTSTREEYNLLTKNLTRIMQSSEVNNV